MSRSSGGDVDLAIPGAQDRDGEMGRGAEAEESYTVARLDARYAKTAKTNNASAQQRRGVQIVELVGKRKREIGANDGVFGIAAIYGVTGEGGRIAEILEAEATISAGSVGSSHPGNSDARAGRKIIRGPSYYFTDNLMSGDYSWAARRQVAFNYVQVSAAYSTGTYTQENLAWLRFGSWKLSDPKRALPNVLR